MCFTFVLSFNYSFIKWSQSTYCLPGPTMYEVWYLMSRWLVPGFPSLSSSNIKPACSLWGFAGGSAGKESSCQCRKHKRCGFDPWVRKIPWSRKWQPIPVFLPGKFHIQRSLVNYSPWGHRESDMAEHTTGISGIKWLKHSTKLENHHARDVHFIDSLHLYPSHAPILQHPFTAMDPGQWVSTVRDFCPKKIGGLSKLDYGK